MRRKSVRLRPQPRQQGLCDYQVKRINDQQRAEEARRAEPELRSDDLGQAFQHGDAGDRQADEEGETLAA